MAADKGVVSALDKATQHFADYAPEPFDVPEWGIKVFPKNENMQGRVKRRSLIKKKDYDESSSFAYAVILLSMKEDGTPHFVSGDRLALASKTDPDVLERVALACLGRSVEAAKKN